VNIEDILSRLWHWALLKVLFVALTTLLGKGTGPLSDWIVKRAARRLPPKYRKELEDQWLADFYELPPWLRLKSALSVLFARPSQYEFPESEDSYSGFIDLDTLRSKFHFEQNANRDALTGVMNRRSFEARLSALLAPRRWRHRQLSLVLMNIDGLKPINAIFGHGAGDALLKEMARRVQVPLRRRDQICRFGGDEFGILLPNTTPEEALEIAEKVRRACELSIRGSEFQGPARHQFQLSASFGVTSQHDESDIYAIVGDADTALYWAKKEGRNRVRQYPRLLVRPGRALS
jgi:diguanylate cyclase (GGDEF)-like protein